MMYPNSGDVSSLLASSSSSAAAGGNPDTSYPLLHHHSAYAVMIPLPPPFTGEDDELQRLPHWSHQETRVLIEMRAQVEWEFAAAKKNRNLWEMVADRMRDKGYWRSADQCKWKWKSLVSRYKGQEPSDADAAQPFQNELNAVFAARANRMQQSQAEAEAFAANTMQQSQAEAVAVVAKGKKRLHDASEGQSNEEFKKEQEDGEETEADQQAGKAVPIPKRKAGRGKRQKVTKNESVHSQLKEIMRNFMQQQMTIDMEWKATMDKRAEERERFEQEWQQKMEMRERESLMLEKEWREREEERRMRVERRAERRDELIVALLNRIINNDD